MKILTATGAVLLLAGAAAAQTNAADDYRILSSVSIFSRDRGASAATSRGQLDNIVPQRSSAAAPVLVGVMKSTTECVAVLEVPDRQGAGQIINVREGDTIAWDNSRVVDVTMDALHLTGGAQSAAVVSVGNNLKNEPGNLTAALPVIPSSDAGIQGADLRRMPSSVGMNIRGSAPLTPGVTGRLRSRIVPGGAAPARQTSLPPGSSDDVAARMRLRRQTQIGGTPAADPPLE